MFNADTNLKSQNFDKCCKSHRFLLLQKLRQDGHVDMCGQEVNMEDHSSNFLSWNQIHTCRRKSQQNIFRQIINSLNLNKSNILLTVHVLYG